MLGLTRREAQAALRRDHRVRGARGVRRPEAEELLVGHERAPRLLRRDPGRRRRAAGRRGARGGRRAPSSASASTSSTRMRAEGRTILFVTHDMGSVERFCDRAMLLERGRVLDHRTGRGDRPAVPRGELRDDRASGRAPTAAGRRGPHRQRLVRGRRAASRSSPPPRASRGLVVPRGRGSARRWSDPISPSRSATRCGTRSSWPRQRPTHGRSATFAAGERVTVRLSFENWLAPSRYTLTPAVGRRGTPGPRDRLAARTPAR